MENNLSLIEYMNTDNSCSQNKEKSTVILNVTQITTNKQYAHVSVETPAKNGCQACASGKGCQSLSVYQLIFAKRPLKIDNKNYYVGQQLQAVFPNYLLQQSLYLLLGLPLLGFIVGAIIGSFTHELIGFGLGIVMATSAYFLAKKQAKNLFSRHFQLTKIEPIAIHN